MRNEKMWAFMIQLGNNMWDKKGRQTVYRKDEEESIYRDFLYTDRETWEKVTAFLPSCGINTVLILDNSITGMTGHQDNPTTGFTIRKEPTKQVDLLLLCKAVGIEHVTVADPFDLKNFEKVVKEEVEREEPSVIISRRPCVLLNF